MSTIQHTPGPWRAIKGDVFNPDRTWGVSVPLSKEACIEIDGDDSLYGHRTEVIAEIMAGSTDEADARLVAAAPELLALCKTLRQRLADLVRHVDEDTDSDADLAHDRDAVDDADAAIAKAEGRE